MPSRTEGSSLGSIWEEVIKHFFSSLTFYAAKILIFNFSLGPAILRGTTDLVADEWITVTANRDSKEGRLSVDGDDVHKYLHRVLDLNLRTPLYVGGYDKEKIKVSSHVGVEDGFHGCISEVRRDFNKE